MWRSATLALATALAAGACVGAPAASSPSLAPMVRVVNPYSLTLDPQGRVIVADGQGHRIVRLDPRTGSGTSLASGFVFPIHVAFDSSGAMFVADVDAFQVKRVAADGTTTPILGTGKEGPGGATGGPTAIDIPWVYAIAFDRNNDMVFIESPPGGGSVRKLQMATGTITTVAAGLKEPHGLAIDAQGRYVVADTMHHRIVRVDPATGTLTVIAGSSDRHGFGGDGGPATAATLDQPRQVAFDRSGALFFADDAANRIRRIGPDGAIATVAGDGSTGLGGDGGPASAAGLRGVWGVAVTDAGDLYVASPPAARVRKVDGSTQVISTVGPP